MCGYLQEGFWKKTINDCAKHWHQSPSRKSDTHPRGAQHQKSQEQQLHWTTRVKEKQGVPFSTTTLHTSILPMLVRQTALLAYFWTWICSSDLVAHGFTVPSVAHQRSFLSPRLQATTTPFGVLVEAEIEPDRMAEFLKMIENNAIATRKEPGCLRFDVLRSQDANNKFYFYELYGSEKDVDFHKTQPHYESWAKFKESGGTISSTSHKMDGEFIP